MKKTMLALVLLFGCGTLFAQTRFSVGIGIGGYGPVYGRVPPPPPAYVQPPCPGAGYDWVAGYWYPQGPRFYWRSGYWRAPAYFGYRGGPGYGRGYGWSGGYYGGRYGESWQGGRGRYYGNESRHDYGRGRHAEGGYRR
jgi:hypothetical protein